MTTNLDWYLQDRSPVLTQEVGYMSMNATVSQVKVPFPILKICVISMKNTQHFHVILQLFTLKIGATA